MNAMNFTEHIPPNEHILCEYFLCGLCERNNFHEKNAMNFKEHIPPNEHILCGYFLCGLCERNNFHA
jgi:hypothetical protein